MPKKFNPEWRKREPAKCVVCESTFMAATSDIKRGWGTCCSRRCANARGGAAALAKRSQKGSDNANWRGGIAADPDLTAAKRRYRAAHPARAIAHRKLSYAIEKGALVRGPCECCGAVETEGHHQDYSKPLEVRWLCRGCHRQEHYAAA